MPDNDARDPLDSWLDQQIKPLPPPPGTFDMITRRARRRKARKLAVTVVSAAAVVAAVTVAVPGVTSLHLGTTGESGNTVADGGPRSSVNGRGGGTAGLNGSGTRSVTPAPTVSTPASNAGPPAGPVPANFSPTSVTFVSATHAWVIGQAGTPGKCYNGSICTSVAWTSDDGATWHGGPAPVAGAPDGPSGVSGIRFLDGVNGWAFGPELWVTHDSGNTWHQLSTNGMRVTDLETAGSEAYALFAKCSGSSPAGFAADCTSYTLMTTTATSDNWVPVGNATSGLSRDGGAGSAMLALTGTNGYLVAPDGTVYSGPLGGTWSQVGTAPCQPSFPPQANGLPASGMVALSGANDLTMACDGGPSATSPTAIYSSSDGGAHWTRQSAAAWSNVSVPESSITSLAAASNGALVLASTDGIYVLPSGGSTWQAATAAGAAPTSGGLSASGGLSTSGASGNTAPSASGASASASPSPSASSSASDSAGGTGTNDFGGTSANGSGSGLPSGGFSYVGMTSQTQGVAIPANTSLDEIWLTTDGGLTWSPSPITG